MPVEVIVPEVGEVGMALVFVDWLREEGDRVEAGDALFELDTDKTTVEVEAYAAGVLAGRRVAAGDTVVPRQVIAYLLQDGESADALAAATKPVAEQARDEPASPPVGIDSDDGRSRVRATPRARAFARERGVDLSEVRGRSDGGLITVEDVEAQLAARDNSHEIVPRTRATVSARTTEAWREVPHFHLRLEIDATDAVAQYRPTTAICAAAARALAAHPECNLEWRGGEIRRRDTVDLGLLVSTDAGLLLPTLNRADSLSVEELDSRLRELTERARVGHLRPDDLAPRSLTVSNLGMFAVDGFDAVISAPDVLLLSVGRARTQPRWFGDGWRARRVLEVTLAVDHRALDGAEAARLLGTIEELILAPARLV
jgi:pyruvate dehydrogenase E2 component (dihydrolipoamide acetyltransferase)